ncbi:MAG: hypothetical protein MH204_08870 [Fimbriimonadaceae bacterium]|nr:hypothetical protein [Fimbriimonadaceae bacterium]
MRAWIAGAAAAAVGLILAGCGGEGPYVPSFTAGTGDGNQVCPISIDSVSPVTLGAGGATVPIRLRSESGNSEDLTRETGDGLSFQMSVVSGPGGISSVFSPSSVIVQVGDSRQTELRLTNTDQAPGTFFMTVRAQNPACSAERAFQVTVPTLSEPFRLDAVSSSISTNPDRQGAADFVVRLDDLFVAPSGRAPVTFSASIDGLTDPFSGTSFSPPSVNPTREGTDVRFGFDLRGSVEPGMYTLRVTGSDGTRSSSVAFMLQVPDFSGEVPARPSGR